MKINIILEILDHTFAFGIGAEMARNAGEVEPEQVELRGGGERAMVGFSRNPEYDDDEEDWEDGRS